MRLDDATISLRPRSVSNCLDLAVLFAAQHPRPLLILWACVALPTCAGVWVMLEYGGGDARFVGLLLYAVTSPLGVLAASGAIPCVLGERFAFERMWLSSGRTLLLILQGLLLRIPIALGLIACVAPGAWLAVRYGFFVEQNALRELDEQLACRPTRQLVNEEASDLVARGIVIFSFCGILALVLFLSVDAACQILFDAPVLIGRLDPSRLIANGAAPLEELGRLLLRDPFVLSVASAVVLFVYPLGRLAWFFCYVDLRVRRDLWDMELRFSEEERRLRETSES